MKNRLSNKDWIYLIFFLSGVSGLIYEIVWLRILSRVLGSTVYATSITLAAFMAGLALGSFAIDRWARKAKNLLRLYSYLQLGIGLSAIGLLFVFPNLVPVYRVFYHFSGGHRFVLTLVQSLIMFILLIIPTFLMGGTLPLLASHTKRYERSFTDRIGHLYGLNTLGAVLGVLGSGLIFIGLVGEQKTILLGVILNLFAAYIAYLLSKEETEESIAAETISPYGGPVKKVILIAYALSGFTALAYEVVWTRMFQIYTGTSIYAFSLMLAFYLLGLGAGSVWGARTLRQTDDPLPWFSLAQFGIALYSIIGLYLLAFVVHPVPNHLDLGNILTVPLIIVTPITFLLGAMFPLISKSYVRDETGVVRSVGTLYAINTVGCILGSLFCGFVFIAVFGTKGTILVLAGLNVLIGLIVLASGRSSDRFRALAAGMVLTALVLGLSSPDPFLQMTKTIQQQIANSYRAVEIGFFFHRESRPRPRPLSGLKIIFRQKGS